MAAIGTEMYLLMPKICIDAATPANSATVLPRSTSKRGDHDEERGAEAEFLADQIGEAFAGDHAHARAHFFGDVERDGHGNERPEQRVAELRAGGGVDGDAAGVVVHVRGDQARADDGEKERRGGGGTVRARRLNSLPRISRRANVRSSVIQVFIALFVRHVRNSMLSVFDDQRPAGESANAAPQQRRDASKIRRC